MTRHNLSTDGQTQHRMERFITERLFMERPIIESLILEGCVSVTYKFLAAYKFTFAHHISNRWLTVVSQQFAAGGGLSCLFRRNPGDPSRKPNNRSHTGFEASDQTFRCAVHNEFLLYQLRLTIPKLKAPCSGEYLMARVEREPCLERPAGPALRCHLLVGHGFSGAGVSQPGRRVATDEAQLYDLASRTVYPDRDAESQSSAPWYTV